jgi:hypothetical protein
MFEQEYLNRENYFKARYQNKLIEILKTKVFNDMDCHNHELKQVIFDMVHQRVNTDQYSQEQVCDMLECLITDLSAENSFRVNSIKDQAADILNFNRSGRVGRFSRNMNRKPPLNTGYKERNYNNRGFYQEGYDSGFSFGQNMDGSRNGGFNGGFTNNSSGGVSFARVNRNSYGTGYQNPKEVSSRLNQRVESSRFNPNRSNIVKTSYGANIDLDFLSN